jgi:hypothetical protein
MTICHQPGIWSLVQAIRCQSGPVLGRRTFTAIFFLFETGRRPCGRGAIAAFTSQAHLAPRGRGQGARGW